MGHCLAHTNWWVLVVNWRLPRELSTRKDPLKIWIWWMWLGDAISLRSSQLHPGFALQNVWDISVRRFEPRLSWLIILYMRRESEGFMHWLKQSRQGNLWFAAAIVTCRRRHRGFWGSRHFQRRLCGNFVLRRGYGIYTQLNHVDCTAFINCIVQDHFYHKTTQHRKSQTKYAKCRTIVRWKSRWWSARSYLA